MAAASTLPAAALVASGHASADSPPTKPRYAPVPAHARPRQIPSKGYLLDDLGGGVYGVGDGIYQSLFIVTRTGVIAIDAPVDLGARLLNAVAEVTTKPVTHVIYSHAHRDHIGSAHLFGNGARYIAHELTGNLLRLAKDPIRPLPTFTFRGQRHVLTVGGQRLILDYHGNVHEEGNLFIHLPEQRVLMVVDVVTPRWAPLFRFGQADNVAAYIRAHELIREYSFDTYVGGHFGWFGNPENIEENAEYLADLRKAAQTAINTVDTGEVVIGVDPHNTFAQYKAYIDALTARTIEVMPTSRWLTRLGGADVFLPENAISMVFGLLLD